MAGVLHEAAGAFSAFARTAKERGLPGDYPGKPCR